MIQFDDYLLDYNNKGLKLYKLNNNLKSKNHSLNFIDNYSLIEEVSNKEVNSFKTICEKDKVILNKILNYKLGDAVYI